MNSCIHGFDAPSATPSATLAQLAPRLATAHLQPPTDDINLRSGSWGRYADRQAAAGHQRRREAAERAPSTPSVSPVLQIAQAEPEPIAVPPAADDPDFAGLDMSWTTDAQPDDERDIVEPVGQAEHRNHPVDERDGAKPVRGKRPTLHPTPTPGRVITLLEECNFLRAIIRDSRFTGPDHTVAEMLLSYYSSEWGYAWPSVEQIAALTGLSHSTIKRSIRVLTAKDGFFNLQRESWDGHQPNNRYSPNITSAMSSPGKMVDPRMPVAIDRDRSNLTPQDGKGTDDRSNLTLHDRSNLTPHDRSNLTPYKTLSYPTLPYQKEEEREAVADRFADRPLAAPTPQPVKPAATSDRPKAARTTGTRLPEDWEPDHDGWQHGRDLGLTDAFMEHEFETFQAYWLGKSKDATKASWPLTWKSWLLREAKRKREQAERQQSFKQDRVQNRRGAI